MNEKKRKILNIALIIINVILVVAIARVSILLYYEIEPNDYQTIICKYNPVEKTLPRFSGLPLPNSIL